MTNTALEEKNEAIKRALNTYHQLSDKGQILCQGIALHAALVASSNSGKEK